MLFAHALREARCADGLSRGQLRLRILRYFETAPSLSAIRDLENGISQAPQGQNLAKFKRALPGLDRILARPETVSNRNVP